MIWLWCCFCGIMAKFVSKLSYVFSLLSFRKLYFLQKKVGNNLLIGDFAFSLQKLSSEEVFFPHLFVESFLSGNLIFISLNKSRCSKHLCMRSQVMGKDRNKNKCVLVPSSQEFLFSSSCNRPLWEFVLRHEFVQCISGS